MESVSNIGRFLIVPTFDGDGDGNGDGRGNGDGKGYGNGDGKGNGYGDGYGDGDGYGVGNGNGKGKGRGRGNGVGYGDGNGDGNGYGDGNTGFVSINGEKVHYIDGIPTVIFSVHGDYASAGILQHDLTFKTCYVARAGNEFAHGETLRKAREDAQDKRTRKIPLKERLAEFKAAFPEWDTPYFNSDLYRWHNVLTGSYRMGRDEFAREHGIDVEGGKMTVREFVSLTEHSYGGKAVSSLRELYG